ncbi:MAG: alpha/beta hydrolase, partial [Panacagrimonas sp.]
RDTSPEALVPDVTAVDRMIPGAESELRARIYTPAGAGVFPVVVYFHGGGWVIADLDVYDAGARGIAKQARAIVVSVDYRQAPEHKFPAAWDDALAAYRWVAMNCAEFRGDAARLALAGESAGGCLAIATAIAARDLSLPPPRHIVAIYPVAQTGSLSTPSYIENAMAVPLNRAMIPWFLGHLLRSDTDKADTRLDLVNAELRGLPDVTLISAMLDPLRSDGAMMEDALKAAGVPVLRKDYHGVAHEFFGAAAVVRKAREAQRLVGERLRHAFI